MNGTPITAIIPCKDELPNIEACIESLRPIVDEIIVADSLSTDGTLELVESCSDCRVIQREYINPSDFKNWAIPQATHEWILLLDADERVSPELAAEIAALKEATLAQTTVSAYWIGRQNYFLGRRVRFSGWQNDGVVRLFRRECRYEVVQVHEEIDMSGIEVGRLKHCLIHHTYRSFAHYFEKMQRYTTWGAQDLYARGRRGKMSDLVLRPPFRFFRHYVLKLGFLDGLTGYLLATLSGISVFLKYVKLWEISLNRDRESEASNTESTTLPRQKAA
ncbi:MAG: glycosyltransferase family 2 protein [Planctomycetaceae bacterium]|nr:glycosyltransferase family 2 protein [Planctomycetaceae bacterium]